MTERITEKDTNFGNLKRIPHPRLRAFLAKYRFDGAVEEQPELPWALEGIEKTLHELEGET